MHNTKKLLQPRIAASLALVMLLALASCQKERLPLDPPAGGADTIAVTESNYFLCDTDSLGISAVVAMRSQYGSHLTDWTFKFSDMQILTLTTAQDLLAGGTFALVDPGTACQGASGVYGLYIEGYEDDELVQGTLQVSIIGHQPQFILQAVSRSGRILRMHYWGQAYNLTQALGSGTFDYGNKSLPLQVAYSQYFYDIYEYAFTDTLSSFGVTFYSVSPLRTGTYAISDDLDQVEFNQALNLYISVESDGFQGDVSSGSAVITLDGDQISLTFQGQLQGVSLTGSYAGTIVSL